MIGYFRHPCWMWKVIYAERKPWEIKACTALETIFKAPAKLTDHPLRPGR